MDLARVTGAPASAIFGDLDEFERQNKTQIASDIVRNNPHLSDFVQSDPMVPKIANDDYGNLDAVSQKTSMLDLGMKVLKAPRALGALMFGEGDPLHRFKEGGPLGSWILEDDNIRKNYPFAGAVAAGLATPIELILRGLSGAQNTAADMASNLVGAVDPSLGRDLGAMIQSAGMTGRTGLVEHPIYKVAEQVGPIKHWIDNGREPPPGVLKDYDTFRAERNTRDVDQLSEVVADAQSSLVRERNPDLFRDFIARHTDAEIGLSGDAIVALYGDKRPLPDDGLLGWVPGIAEQLELARKSGDDISVPLADWVARVDPEVMKALKDDIRVRPGAITANEVKLAAEQNQALEAMLSVEAWHGSRHDLKAFSNDAIGTGEGAQVYGHGHYLGEAEGTGKYYMNAGARGDTVGGKRYNANDPEHVAAATLWRWQGDAEKAVSTDLIPQAERLTGDPMREGERQKIMQAIKIIESGNVQKFEPPAKGNLYRAKINVEEHELLDLDKLLDEQPSQVIDAIDRIPNIEKYGDMRTGHDLIDQLANFDISADGRRVKLPTNRERATRKLQEVGLKGSQYFDQISRAEKAGSRNYVIFDGKDIEVTEKNGQPIAEELPAQRHAAGLEPMLSVGDRNLKIEKLAREPRSYDSPDFQPHDFKLLDEQGNPVGTIALTENKGGKDIWIDMINGINGLGPRDFGPALMRSLLRQMKEQFPNAERLGGFRASGARELAGKMDEAWIKLDNPDMEQFQQVLEGGKWERYSPNIEAYVKPFFERSEEDRNLINMVNDELERIVGPNVFKRPADRLKASGVRGQIEDTNPTGTYIPYTSTYPVILYALEGDNPLGTARHEAIHHLRGYGFFKDAEWATLEKTAMEQGWLDQFQIKERYPTLDHAGRLEESIADAYKEWESGRFEAIPEVQSLFERMKQFFDTIRERISQMLGKPASWEDIFQKVSTGEVAERTGNTPRWEGAFNEKLSAPEEPSRIFERANALGMTIEQYKRYDKLIAQRHAEDTASATTRIADAQKRVQTKEWKANRATLRAQVAEEINLRPDIAADNYFADGVLYGEKVERVKLGTDFLTEEQRAVLPRDYYNKAGASPDDLAGMFGFPDGATLVQHLSGLSEIRRQSGMRPIEFKRRVIDIETDRQMQAKYGVLENNIMDAVKEQVASETQLSLLHEETLYYAIKAGEEPLLDKEAVVRMVGEEFEQSKVSNVSSDRYLAVAGRAGKAVENALLKQDFAGAFREKQRQFYATVLAKEAIQFENQTAKFEKLATRLAKREVKAVEPEYLDFIHGLLGEAGVPIKRSMDEVAQSKVYHGQEDLAAFVASKDAEGWSMGEVISDEILSGKIKSLDAMSVAEMRDFMNAITTLNHTGRAVRKIEIAGEKKDFAEFRSEVVRNIQELPARSRESQNNWFYKIDASLTRMEEMAKDLDLRKELGPLHQAVIEPMMRSKAAEFDLMTDLSKHFQETRGSFDRKWRKSLNDTIAQDVLHDPYTGVAYDMTRENLINVMLQWGNRSNIGKMVNGAFLAKFGRRASKEEFAAYETQIKGLVDKHASLEDWQFVQRMWQPFKGWEGKMADVSRATTGVAPKMIPPSMVETPHGTFEGGYWPVKYDKLGSNAAVVADRKPTEEGVFGGDYFRAATAKGYLKERTGYVDFVDISTSLEQAAGTMQQTIHDIAFRDSLIQAGRVFYDKGIRAAIRKHYGTEYEAQLVPWLRRIAHQFSTDDTSIAGLNDFMRRVRINLVGHALPLNLKVILSPDVGVPNPKAWASYMANRKDNLALAMEKSDEIRHLVYNMDRDFRESMDRVTLDPTVSDFQKKAVQWGFGPIAKVSQEFRVSTFVDQYHKALGRGKTEQEAALIADSFVRERHGAASVVDLPSVMQSNEGMKMLTMFYGYFNTMYNWQRQMVGNVRRGEAKDFMVNGLGSVVVGAGFGAALFNQRKEDDSWFKIIGKAMMLQPLSTVPIVREMASYFSEGFQPRTPFASLLGAAGSIITDAKKVYKGERLEKPITHAANVIGLSTGLPLAQVGRTAQFGTDVYNGRQKPKNIGEWARGIITGEAKLKK